MFLCSSLPQPRQLSGEAEEQVLEVSHDVRTVSGLVALVTECMDSGLSDEATIMKRHMRSPDFGHPLLVLATRTGEDDDWPHMPDEDEVCLFSLLKGP